MELLVPMLIVALALGDVLARITGIEWLINRMERAELTLARKLDRPKRSIATRVYRGMFAMLFLLIPALILGTLLSAHSEAVRALSTLFLTALFAHGFATWSLLRNWRAAKAGTLALELPKLDYLFTDSHSVLRYLILENGERFATFVVGNAFWFILLGLPGCFAYLTLAILAHHFRGHVFGWAAGALFRLLDATPRFISCIFLSLGALFIPGAKPFRAFSARSFPGLLAALLNIALGGRMPLNEIPWVGNGTAKLEPNDLSRYLLIRLAATVLLVLALSTKNIVNILY